MTAPAAVTITVWSFGLLFTGACLGYMLRDADLTRQRLADRAKAASDG